MAALIRISAGLLGLFAIADHRSDGLWRHTVTADVKAKNLSLVVTTWATDDFQKATEAAWKALQSSQGDTLQAVIAGCSRCQELGCDGTVGYGGSPDEFGETTLDAMVMDGPTGDVGAVAALKRIKNAVAVAAAVAKYTKHTLIVGDSATKFALEMGFKQEDLHTAQSVQIWKSWVQSNCQPNFRRSVIPDPGSSCGPYKPLPDKRVDKQHAPSHDTIGVMALHGQAISLGTSTNGAKHKIPGRVGDSPIPGAGGFVDNDIGAACATGDGDILMRMAPSYQTVENMRNGMSPNQAAEDALKRIAKRYKDFNGAIVAVDSNGSTGGACYGFDAFAYCLRTSEPDNVQVINVTCLRDS